jgi:hypothetical protein
MEGHENQTFVLGPIWLRAETPDPNKPAGIGDISSKSNSRGSKKLSAQHIFC